jgi:hypothetical protein
MSSFAGASANASFPVGTVITPPVPRTAGGVIDLVKHWRYNEARRKQRRDDAAPLVNNVQQERRLRAIEDCAAALEIPDNRRAAFAKMVGDFLDAGETATARAKPGPRPKWPADALPDETPAHFASRAGYVHRGEMNQEDTALGTKLRNWLRTHDWPADVPYIPTFPQWNRRTQAAKLPELRAKIGDDARELERLEAVERRHRGSGESIPAP